MPNAHDKRRPPPQQTHFRYARRALIRWLPALYLSFLAVQTVVLAVVYAVWCPPESAKDCMELSATIHVAVTPARAPPASSSTRPWP